MVMPAVALEPNAAKAIFSGLGESVREVDFVGWLREDLVAAAALAPSASTTSPQAQKLLAERVSRAISRRLPSALARALSVRILPVTSNGAARRWNEPVRIASGH